MTTTTAPATPDHWHAVFAHGPAKRLRWCCATYHEHPQGTLRFQGRLWQRGLSTDHETEQQADQERDRRTAAIRPDVIQQPQM